MNTKALLKLLKKKLQEKEVTKLPGGQMETIPGTDAVQFKGASHEKGGIQLDKYTEVEGGETMDKVVLNDGVPNDYFFSKHLKHNGKSFAQLHKDILKHGGAKMQQKIQNLARLQEHRAGRDVNIVLGDKVMYGSDAGKYMSNYKAKNGGVRKYHKGGKKDHVNLGPPSNVPMHTHSSYSNDQSDTEWAASTIVPKRVKMYDLQQFTEKELEQFIESNGTWVPKRFEEQYPNETLEEYNIKVQNKQLALDFNEQQKWHRLNRDNVAVQDNTRVVLPNTQTLEGYTDENEEETFEDMVVPNLLDDLTYNPMQNANLVLKNKKIKNNNINTNNNTSNNKSNTSGGSGSGNNTTTDPVDINANFKYEGFENKEDGNRFRNWVNLNYPEYAKEIKLDKEGSHKNKYIKTALEKYGDEYTQYLAREDGYNGDTFDIEEDRDGTKVKVNPFGYTQSEWYNLPMSDKIGYFDTEDARKIQKDADFIADANREFHLDQFDKQSNLANDWVTVVMKDGRQVVVPKKDKDKYIGKENYEEAESHWTNHLEKRSQVTGLGAGTYTDDEGNLWEKDQAGRWRVKYMETSDEFGTDATTLAKEWTTLGPENYPGEMNLTPTGDQTTTDKNKPSKLGSMWQQTKNFVAGADLKGLLVDIAQFIPVHMAMKDKPGHLKHYAPMPEVKLNRVKFNEARSKNSSDFNAMNLAIDNSGHDPTTFAKKMALYGKSTEADLAIDASEARENAKIDAAEAGQNAQIRSENLKNRLYVDEFNLASDSATFDRKLNAMSTAVQNLGLLRERALQYKGQALMADAIGRDGINKRQQLRGDMLTKYSHRTINGMKFSEMSDEDQSLFISNVTNNNLNVMDLFD